MTQTLFDTKTRLEADFERFDSENPKVWNLFRDFTFDLIDKGHKHCSSDMILHRIRWETKIQTGGEFKINNNYSPYYARKFERIYPYYKGFFRTRKIGRRK